MGDRVKMSAPIGAILMAAASMSIGAGGWMDYDRYSGGGRDRPSKRGKPSAVPTDKRAKVKAARKANRRRKSS